MTGHLARAFPVRVFSFGRGADVVAMEYPDAGTALRRMLLLGKAPDGHPIAMDLPLPTGRRLTRGTVAEAIASPANRSEFDAKFVATLDAMDVGHFMGHFLFAARPEFAGLKEWLRKRTGASEEAAGRAASAHVLENADLRAALNSLRIGSRHLYVPEMTATAWRRIYGDPDGGWFVRLRVSCRAFVAALDEAAARPEWSLRKDLADEENVLLALGEDAADRRLVRLVRAVAPRRAGSGPHLLAMLRECPPEWVPGSEEEWRAAERIAVMAVRLRDVTGFPLRRLVAPAKGRWADWAAALEAVDPPEPPATAADLGAGADGAEDMLQAFASQVIFPVLRLRGEYGHRDAVAGCIAAVEGEREAVAAALFGAASAAGIMEAVAKWHRMRFRMEGALAAVSPEFSAGRAWPAALPAREGGVRGASGARVFRVVPLTSQRMLADEGAALDHCVAGFRYVAACLEGRSRIVSLRERLPDGSERRLSTAELRYRGEREGGRFMMVQHKGRANARPSDDECEALLAYRRELEKPGVVDSVDLAAVIEATSASTVAGYDATDPSHVEKALRLWEPFLRRPLRGLSLDAFAEACGLPGRPVGAPSP